MISDLRFLITVTLVAVLAACGGSSTFESVELSASRIAAFWPTTDLQETYVIRSDSEWQAAWQKHEPQTYPKTERPQVDFSKNMVVGLSQGTGPNGCHGLSIRRVVEDEEEIRVEYIHATGQPGLACTQATVALTDFVVVSKSEKRATFIRVGA
ncbi:MAG: hypothetical protein IH627_10515 [Rubrivivax sp.]|nr:hypothetical protein [Rubrivivax sp.]